MDLGRIGEMSSVVLVRVDDENNRFKGQIPLGILYVASALVKGGYRAVCFDIIPIESSKLYSELEKEDTLFCGFSFLTGPQINATMEVARELKKYEIPLICGGIHPTLMPEQCMDSGLFDACVVGEGELASLDIDSSTNGIVHKRFMNQTELDSIELKWDLLNMDRYWIKSDVFSKGISLVASRGCPNACAFCSSETVNKRRWRGHSVEWVLRTVEGLIRNYDIDGISFVDENFFVNRKWAFELADRLTIPWIAASHIEYVDDEFVDRIGESECAGISFGLESGSDRILKLMNKRQTRKSILDGVRQLSRLSNKKLSACVIFAYPTETFDEFKETLSLMMQILKWIPRMTYACGRFLPFPGCRAHGLAIEHGFESPKSLSGWAKFDRWSEEPMPWCEWADGRVIRRTVRYVLVVQGLNKVWGKLGGLVGWLVARGRKSWLLDVLAWAREGRHWDV